MPKYDQLLLEFGGGVINAHSQSEAYKKDACVAIGIGGTGIAALKRLKKDVYQQLIPDDPEAPVPTYSHIKFIAIDSDEIDPGHGKGKLSNSEMFSIKNPNLAGVLGTAKGKNIVKNDPRMSWMDIDNITAIHTPDSAGGIRQRIQLVHHLPFPVGTADDSRIDPCHGSVLYPAGTFRDRYRSCSCFEGRITYEFIGSQKCFENIRPLKGAR